MTDTTDIAALREKFESVFDGNKERNKYHPDVYVAYPTRAAWKYYQMGNELHLSQLEAERQRADKADSRLHEVSVHCANVEAELSALKAKLANPVVLPDKLPDEGYGGEAVRNWCRNETVTDCARRITEAGFTVKEE